MRWEFNFLSNAVFRFVLSIIVLEIMEFFSKRSPFEKKTFFCFYAGGHNFDPTEKMAEIVSTGFLMIFRMSLAAYLCDAHEPELDGGGGEGVKPPPGPLCHNRSTDPARAIASLFTASTSCSISLEISGISGGPGFR